jgi:glucose dehydrogenase
MLKVFRIALYAVGGFFIYMVNLLSFISLAQLTTTQKLGVMALFGVLGLVPILAAMATNHFRAWEVPVGAALLSGVGVTLLVMFTFICMELSPELLKTVPNFPQDALSDYFTGGITTVSLLVAGIALVRSAPEASDRRRSTG